MAVRREDSEPDNDQYESYEDNLKNERHASLVFKVGQFGISLTVNAIKALTGRVRKHWLEEVGPGDCHTGESRDNESDFDRVRERGSYAGDEQYHPDAGHYDIAGQNAGN